MTWRGAAPRSRSSACSRRRVVRAGGDEHRGQNRGQDHTRQPEEEEEHLRVERVRAGHVEPRRQVVADDRRFPASRIS